MTRFRWDGKDEFTRFLRETPGLVVKDLEAALTEEGENIMGRSVRDTPVDTGNLRASAHVKPPVRKRGKVSVTLAYGTDYAIYVHERIGLRHPSGKAKYLEDPVKAAADGMSGRLRRRVLGRIGKRGL